MRNKETIKKWLRETLAQYTVSKESFFNKLWRDGKIHYNDEKVSIDRVDEINAKIAGAAIDAHINTLIIFPDNKMNRGALIMCSLLIQIGTRSIKNQIKARNILYIGTDIHFKHFIQATYIDNLSLANAFSYTDETSKGKKDTGLSLPTEYLPQIICAYNPNSPEEYIRRYKPNIILLDCSDEKPYEWVEDLLHYCNTKNIRVLCWANTYLSQLAPIFEHNGGSVIYYPQKLIVEGHLTLEQIFLEEKKCTVNPIVISGTAIQLIQSSLEKCKLLLLKFDYNTANRIIKDCTKVCWKYLRTLENLSIPINVYNDSASSFWNIYSTTELNATILKYIEFFEKTDSTFSNHLSTFIQSANYAVDYLRQNSSPIWTALNEIILDSDNGSEIISILIFKSKSQKQLFLYALQANCNIDEDQLYSEHGFLVSSLKEAYSFCDNSNDKFKGKKINAIVIGIPEVFNKSRFLQLLSFNVSILLFQNQMKYLKNLISEFNIIEKDHLRKTLKTIKRISQNGTDVDCPNSINRIEIGKITREINLQAKVKVKEEEIISLTNINDPQIELAKLLEAEENESDDQILISRYSRETQNTKSLIVDNAIQVKSTDGYAVLVDENDEVNIIRDGKVSHIYVKALKVGMNIIIVENNSKKSLYDLIISRVHNHPSFTMHITLLNKWREELNIGYFIWQQENKNSGLNDFLIKLESLGSRIVSTVTVSNWLSGKTLRPLDEKDILRIGQIFSNNFLINNYKLIYEAAARIVGIHISLSRKLNDMLENGLDLERHQMDIVDSALDLRFGELLSSVKILKIKSINKLNSSVLSDSLGILKKIE